jgi:DNA topoisomerase-1
MPILVTVESPGKISKIQHILGPGYIVRATCGHIMDLPKTNMAIDMETFEPIYEISPDKGNVVADLRKAYKSCDGVLIATDKDREGEMIAWSVASVLKISQRKQQRIIFDSITSDVIKYAVQNPKPIDMAFVESQKTRRIIDRILGYKLSPLLWHIRQNLSAGRVQSVVVRLLVDRENEISDFMAKELHSKYKFTGKFNEYSANGPEYQTKEESYELFMKLIESVFVIKEATNTEHTKNPQSPYTTSSLQQDAGSKLHFNVKKTMTVAQKLYEAGYITYMRTDSVNLSQVARKNIGDYIIETWGESYHKQRQYKSKNAQEAHECIRPTDAFRESVKMDKDEQALYRLIWQRTIASQMIHAIFNKISIVITPKNIDVDFVSNEDILTEPGFLIVYNKEEKEIPPLPKVGDILDLKELNVKQSYDNPPSRYDETSKSKNEVKVNNNKIISKSKSF